MLNRITFKFFDISRSATVCITMLAVGGCASRPASDVLTPHHLKSGFERKITVLAATNREKDTKDSGYGADWQEQTSYSRYTISVPEHRNAASITYPTRQLDPSKQFIVTKSEPLTRSAFVTDVAKAQSGQRAVGVYVHGFNTSYQEALFRTAQLGADAKNGIPPALFSWPSTGTVTGYVADKDQALSSRDELVRVLEDLSNSRDIKQIVLFGHSMGAFLVMESVRQLKIANKNSVLSKLVVILAAPDIDVTLFKSQLSTIGRLRVPITILSAKDDGALSASSLISRNRARLGRLDIYDDKVQKEITAAGVRVVDITSVKGPSALGHDRYAALSEFGLSYVLADSKKVTGIGGVGTFIFDVTDAVVTTPTRIARKIAGTN